MKLIKISGNSVHIRLLENQQKYIQHLVFDAMRAMYRGDFCPGTYAMTSFEEINCLLLEINQIKQKDGALVLTKESLITLDSVMMFSDSFLRGQDTKLPSNRRIQISEDITELCYKIWPRNNDYGLDNRQRMISKKFHSNSGNNEDSIEIFLPDYSITLLCKISDSNLKTDFPIGNECYQELSLRDNVSIRITDMRTKEISTSRAIGIFRGTKKAENGNTSYVVESLFDLEISDTNWESANLRPKELGSWVEIYSSHSVIFEVI